MYHGRKVQSIVARLFLLDIQYNEYQYTNLGTLEITLNVRTISVTICPNFNMSLHDLYRTETLKIQVQILRTPPARNAIQATLHYQRAWKFRTMPWAYRSVCGVFTFKKYTKNIINYKFFSLI